MNRTVFADHAWHTGIDEQPRAIAVVASDVSHLVDVAALRAANGGGTRGIEVAAELYQISQKVLRAIEVVGEERLVAHTPGDDRGVIAVDPNHLAQSLLAMLLKWLEIFRVRRISTRVPISFWSETALAPEAVLRHEQHAVPVAGVGECRMMRIVRAAHEVKT